MTDRDYLRATLVEVIEKQLTDDIEVNTVNLYNHLLEQGMSDERAKELLAFFLEMYTKENFSDKETYNEEKWKTLLDRLHYVCHIPGEYEFDVQEERKNLRNIQRQYGKLKSDVEELEDELFSIEALLLFYNRVYLTNALEIKKIIHIVINRLFDLKNHYTSDYTDYAHEDILCLADDLEEICNPYMNPQLYDFLSQYVDLKDESQFDYIFKNVFLCLARILVSIDKFEKELGKNGYFHFINQFISLKAYLKNGPKFFFNEKTLQK